MSAKVRARALEAGASPSDTIERLASNVWLCRCADRALVLCSVGYRVDVFEVATPHKGPSGFEIPPDPGKVDELDELAATLGGGNRASGQRRALALVQLMTKKGALK